MCKCVNPLHECLNNWMCECVNQIHLLLTFKNNKYEYQNHGYATDCTVTTSKLYVKHHSYTNVTINLKNKI